jgi:outer membrane protein
MKIRRCFRPALAAAAILSLWSPAILPSFGGDVPEQRRLLSQDVLARRLSHLTLDDAVDLCLHRNPNILRQLQEIQREQGLLIQVRAAALPHLVATGTFEQQDKTLLQSEGITTGKSGLVSGIPLLEPADFGTPVNLNSVLNQLLLGTTGTGGSAGTGLLSAEAVPDKSYDITIQVQQTLYNAAIPPQIREARFMRNAAYYALRETVDMTVNTVKTDFYTVLLDQALITINEQNLHLLESQLQDQQNRFAAGTVPRFDVLQASVAVANQRPAVIAANNNYSLAYIGLARDIGVEYGPREQKESPIKLVGNLDYHRQNFSNEEGVRSAKAERGLLKEQRLNILSEVEAIRVAAAGYQPTLQASGGIEQRNNAISTDFLNDVRGWFWGATFNWNIFDGLATYGAVKQQRALLAEAKATYDDGVRQVVEEVQVNFDNLQQYKETIQSQVLNVSEAEEAVRLSQARLSAGAGTQLDVLQSQVALLQAQTTELQARYNYAVTLANYERVTATSTVYPETFDDPMVRKEEVTGRPATSTGVATSGKKLPPSTVKTPDTQRNGNGVQKARKIDVDKPNMPVRPHSVGKPDEPPLTVKDS